MSSEKINFKNFCLHLNIRPSIQNFENIPKLETKVKNLIQILEKLFFIETTQTDETLTNVYVIDLLSVFLVYLRTIKRPLVNGQNRKTVFDTLTSNMKNCTAKEQMRNFIKQRMNSSDLIFVTSFVVYELNCFKDSCINKDESFWNLWRYRRIYILYCEKLCNLGKNKNTKYYSHLDKLISLVNELYFVPKLQKIVEKMCFEISKTSYHNNVSKKPSVIPKENSGVSHLLLYIDSFAFLSFLHKSFWDLLNTNKDKMFIDFDFCGDCTAKLEKLLKMAMETIHSFEKEFKDKQVYQKTMEKAKMMYRNIKKKRKTKTNDLKDLAKFLEDFFVLIQQTYSGKAITCYKLYY